MTAPRTTFDVTLIAVGREPSLSMTIRSGFSSNRGMQQSTTPVWDRAGWDRRRDPGSRTGRATPGSTVAISPNPSVGATEASYAAVHAHAFEALELIGRTVRVEVPSVNVIGAGTVAQVADRDVARQRLSTASG